MAKPYDSVDLYKSIKEYTLPPLYTGLGLRDTYFCGVYFVMCFNDSTVYLLCLTSSIMSTKNIQNPNLYDRWNKFGVFLELFSFISFIINECLSDFRFI